jgi:hypothetical protein
MTAQKISIPFIMAALLILGSTSMSLARDGADDALELGTKIENRIDLRSGSDSDRDRLEDRSGRINWSFGPGLIGTVTAVNGSTLSVKAGPNGSTYTVDASATSTANIAVGDTVVVQGAINGTSVVAMSVTETKNGKSAIRNNMSGVVGRVTAINGSTITVVGKNDVSYTVNAGNAKVWKNKNNAAKLSDIMVGDSIIVQGTVNGTSVTASNIIDVKLPMGNSDAVLTGVVTAVSDTSITVKASNGTVYTVATAGVEVKDHKNKEKGLKDIHVGDTVTIKGSIDGTSVTASTIIEGNTKGNFLNRIGMFLKSIFGKKQ